MMTRRRGKLVLLLIALLGVFLGLYRIDHEDLFVDESASVFYSRQPAAAMASFSMLQGHFPAYFLLLRYWTQLFGQGVFAMRSLSFVFYFLSILLVYKLSVLLFGNYRASLLSSLLFCISLPNIYYAQEIRMYSANVFLSVLACIFLVKFFDTGRIRYLSWYLLAALLMLSFHIFNVLVLLAHAAYVLTAGVFCKKKAAPGSMTRYLFCLFVLGAACSYLYLLLRSHADPNALRSPFVPGTPFGGLVGMVNSLFFGVTYEVVPADEGRVFLAWQLPGTILLLSLFLRGAFVLSGHKGFRGACLFCIYWFLLPLLAVYLLSLAISAQRHCGYDILMRARYALSSTVPYCLLIAHGIIYLKNKKIAMGIALALLVIAAISVTRYYSLNKKSGWAGVFRQVDELASDREILVCITDNHRTRIPIEFYSYAYYSRRPFRTITPPLGDTIRNDQAIQGVWCVLWKSLQSPENIARLYFNNEFYVRDISRSDNLAAFHFLRKDGHGLE